MQLEDILIITIGSLSALTVLTLMISYVCYAMAYMRHGKGAGDPYTGTDKKSFEPFRDKCRSLIKELCDTDFEEIRIKSHDGLSLYGRYYHVADGAPLEIQAHGYRSYSRRDFSGGGLEALKRGHNLLLIDQRSHGLSEGRSISFGILERKDILSWVNFAVERFGENIKIILVGISMGAATVLMASELDLPKNVRCVIADCPYSSPKEIIMRVVKRKKLPPKIMFPFLWLGGRIFGGFDICEASAEDAVRRSKIPTLIIHGECDRLVPCYMSEKIFENCNMKKKRLATFPDATHGLSFFYDNERYMNEVREFTSDALSEEDTDEN